jgi:hypothetical protein
MDSVKDTSDMLMDKYGVAKAHTLGKWLEEHGMCFLTMTIYHLIGNFQELKG